MQNMNLSDLEMARLREQLGRLPEPRGGRRQLHPLPTVLTIALAATLAGARGYLAISDPARLTQTQLKRAYFDRRQTRRPLRAHSAACSSRWIPWRWSRPFPPGSRLAWPTNPWPAALKGARRAMAARRICSPPCSLVSWPSGGQARRPCGNCRPGRPGHAH